MEIVGKFYNIEENSERFDKVILASSNMKNSLAKTKFVMDYDQWKDIGLWTMS